MMIIERKKERCVQCVCEKQIKHTSNVSVNPNQLYVNSRYIVFVLVIWVYKVSLVTDYYKTVLLRLLLLVT